MHSPKIRIALTWLPVLVFLANWGYLVVARPAFNRYGMLPAPVFKTQVGVMVALAVLLLILVRPIITRASLRIFALGLLLDAIGCLIFMSVPHGIYFDTIGTVLVGVLLGPSAGALTALTSQGAIAFYNPTVVPFYLINMMVGWGAGVLAQMGGFRSKPAAMGTGLLLGVVAGIVAVPLMALNFGMDPTLTQESPDKLIARVMGVFFGDLANPGSTSDPFDKAMVCLLVSFLLRPVTALAGWGRGQ